MSEGIAEVGSGRGEGTPSPEARKASVDEIIGKLWKEHPTWKSGVRPRIAPLPDGAQIARLGKKNLARYLVERERARLAATQDPLWHGWEPPMWTLNDCLLGVPWVDAKLAREVRDTLGFTNVLSVLWLFGANRASKSMYSARTMMRILFGGPGCPAVPGRVVTIFGPTEQWSRKNQQTKVHFYMPEPFRSASKGRGYRTPDGTGYIKYLGVRGGFTDNIFVTPDGSYCEFKFYSQGDDTHEGGAVDGLWCSELASAELLERLQRGLADRDGKFIVDFTPIDGYSPAVRMAMNGAVEVLKSPAFLIAEDGGEPDVEAAMYVEDVIWRVREMQRVHH